MQAVLNRRILIVDDNQDIHMDFVKILGAFKKANSALISIESALFGDDDEDLPSESVVESPQVTYELDHAYQGEEALIKVNEAALENRPYALIFMDVRMPPGIDGIETIARIWSSHTNVEMVICTAYSDYSYDKILERLGSSDRLLFLSKPFDSIAVKQMALSLSFKWNLHEQNRRHVEQLEQEARQRRESEARLHEMIHRDPVTGLCNRRQINISLTEKIMEARKHGTRFALFIIELARFHEVIDTLGYKLGDQLLHLVAERLKTSFGEQGSLFRHGVHEFALLLPMLHTLTETSALAERILSSFECSVDLNELSVDIQACVGVVVFPDHGATADMLMRHGDMTLPHARQSEKGYCYYQESMNKYSPQRLMLLSDLKQALNNDDLLLYFQPRVDLRRREVVGAEALLRWIHLQQGLLPPEMFIPLAEQCGLIKPLTSWVVHKSINQWQHWHAQGVDLEITINLAAQDLQDHGLAEKIGLVMTQVKVPPNRLCFEISERGLMMDREQATHTLAKLHDLGVRVAIDNFGTGYSSLSYLKNLPVHEIKIDRSFIEDLKPQSNGLAIVRSMIDLGHNLGLEVAAEGVATPDALELLDQFGCDFVQGTHINSAIPPGELLLWLQETSWARSSTGSAKEGMGS